MSYTQMSIREALICHPKENKKMTMASSDDYHKNMQVSKATSLSVSEAIPLEAVLKTQDSDKSSYSRFVRRTFSATYDWNSSSSDKFKLENQPYHQ